MEVVAGLIVAADRVLVCQRSARAAFPFKWEFPGGKVEKGETRAHALARELKEELNIHVTRARKLRSHEHAYGAERRVELTFFHVQAFKGTPENRLFNDMRWVRVNELGRLDFLEGDLPLIKDFRDGVLSLPDPTLQS